MAFRRRGRRRRGRFGRRRGMAGRRRRRGAGRGPMRIGWRM